MRQHLQIAVYPFADRDVLANLEHEVLAALDPPLNLDSTASSDTCLTCRARSSQRGALSGPLDTHGTLGNWPHDERSVQTRGRAAIRSLPPQTVMASGACRSPANASSARRDAVFLSRPPARMPGCPDLSDRRKWARGYYRQRGGHSDRLRPLWAPCRESLPARRRAASPHGLRAARRARLLPALRSARPLAPADAGVKARPKRRRHGPSPLANGTYDRWSTAPRCVREEPVRALPPSLRRGGGDAGRGSRARVRGLLNGVLG